MRRMLTTALASMAAPGAALAQSQNDFDRYGPHMMWWDGGWYGMVFGPVFMVIVFALVIAGVVLLVRWMGGAQPMSAAGRAPLDILKERFARGEIDKQEYEDRRRVLGA